MKLRLQWSAKDYSTFSFYILRIWWESKKLDRQNFCLFFLSSKPSKTWTLIKRRFFFILAIIILSLITYSVSELGSTPSTWIFVWYFKYKYLKYRVLEILLKVVYFQYKCISTRVKKRVLERVSPKVMHRILPRVSDRILCMTFGETLQDSFFYAEVPVFPALPVLFFSSILKKKV